MVALPLPPRAFLNECFTYDCGTGAVCWRIRPDSHFASAAAARTFNARFSGSTAGRKMPNGYVQVRVRHNGTERYIYAHRLAFWLVHGREPEDVDHINGIRDDNRILNLRAATRQQNIRNSKSKNKFMKGVYWDKDRRLFIAATSVKSKRVFLGRFASEQDAHEAYCTFARANYGDFYRAA